MVFIPMGPVANELVGSETDGTGMPTFKGLTVEEEPA
jgi:formylmethanofuran dehydrogenase subunit D